MCFELEKQTSCRVPGNVSNAGVALVEREEILTKQVVASKRESKPAPFYEKLASVLYSGVSKSAVDTHLSRIVWATVCVLSCVHVSGCSNLM